LPSSLHVQLFSAPWSLSCRRLPLSLKRTRYSYTVLQLSFSPSRLTYARSLTPPQTAACLSLLSSTLNSSSSLEHDLSLFLDTILRADFPQIVARQTLTEYVANLKSIADQDQRKQVMAMSLPKLQQRVTTFEEQVSPPLVRATAALARGQANPSASSSGLLAS
jgi:hypothetical protein